MGDRLLLSVPLEEFWSFALRTGLSALCNPCIGPLALKFIQRLFGIGGLSEAIGFVEMGDEAVFLAGEPSLAGVVDLGDVAC